MADSTKKQEGGKDEEFAGQKEIQERVDQEVEQGYIGEVADPIPNEAYSIKSGPDSPSVAEGAAELAKSEAEKDKDRHEATKNAI